MVLVVYRLTGAMSGVVMYVFMGNDLVYVNMTLWISQRVVQSTNLAVACLDAMDCDTFVLHVKFAAMGRDWFMVAQAICISMAACPQLREFE